MGLLSFLGLTSSAQQNDQNDDDNPVKALPSNWYICPDMYDLERRAIFSRQWQLITHLARLRAPGDFVKFEVAGFEFVLTHDRHGNINAFHNVCRHRAYPVVSKDCGSAKIFSCKYHGWSYSLSGKLAKAPGYQELADFDKEKNGLFAIHIHTDSQGFVWINLDSNSPPEIDWVEPAKDIKFDEPDFVFDHAWQIEGSHNWKILVENYLQKYHPSSQASASDDTSTYMIDKTSGQILAKGSDDRARGDDILEVLATYCFPNAATSISPQFFVIQRSVPIGPSSSTLTYQIFRHKNLSTEACENISTAYKTMLIETKETCDVTQGELSGQVYLNNIALTDDNDNEEESNHFRQAIRDSVVTHHENERRARQEIWPARQKVSDATLAEQSHKDVAFCASLCTTEAKDELTW